MANPQNAFSYILTHLGNSIEGGAEVGHQVGRRLDAHREPHQAAGTSSGEPAADTWVIGAGVLDERLHAAERLGEGEQAPS